MEQEKNVYEAPRMEVVPMEKNDTILTSGGTSPAAVDYSFERPYGFLPRQ